MIHLNLREGRTSFRPGENVEGTASWRAADPVRSLSVRLRWSTRGRGAPESEVVEQAVWAEPRRVSEEDFRLALPALPYSVRGRLFVVTWCVDAVLEPSGEIAVVELVVSPDGNEILLCPEAEAVPRTPPPPPVATGGS